MLTFPTPSTHQSTRRWALLFVLLAGASLLILKPVPRRTPAPGGVGFVKASCPLTREISLQETLDRLGFSINVPASTALAVPGSHYRSSTRSDALHAEWFRVVGSCYTAEFEKIEQQSHLAPQTIFGYRAEDGKDGDVMLIPADSKPRLWLNPNFSSASASWFSLMSTNQERHQFCIFHTDTQALGTLACKPLYSASANNPTRRSQVLVFHEHVGGYWEDEGNNSGHWAGGVNTGRYLLCWDDLPEGAQHFQDLIILADGIRPVP